MLFSGSSAVGCRLNQCFDEQFFAATKRHQLDVFAYIDAHAGGACRMIPEGISGLNQSVTDRIANELRRLPNAELSHQAGAVCLDRLRAD